MQTPRRTFVLQVDSADESGAEVGGRVEHVASGHHVWFRDAAALLAFVSAVLRRENLVAGDAEDESRDRPPAGAPDEGGGT